MTDVAADYWRRRSSMIDREVKHMLQMGCRLDEFELRAQAAKNVDADFERVLKTLADIITPP